MFATTGNAVQGTTAPVDIAVIDLAVTREFSGEMLTSPVDLMIINTL
jgi:hypothetical protein